MIYLRWFYCDVIIAMILLRWYYCDDITAMIKLRCYPCDVLTFPPQTVLLISWVSRIWTSITWFDGLILGWIQFLLLPQLSPKNITHFNSEKNHLSPFTKVQPKSPFPQTLCKFPSSWWCRDPRYCFSNQNTGSRRCQLNSRTKVKQSSGTFLL